MNGNRREEVYLIARAKSTPSFDIPTLPEFKIEYGEDVEPEPPPKPLVLIIVVTRYTLTEEELALLNRGLLVPEEESEVIEEEDELEEEEKEPTEEEEEPEEEEDEPEEGEEVFGDVVDRYITLIESTYPEGMVVKKGVRPADPEEKWLTQTGFFSAVSSGDLSLVSIFSIPRYKNYVELHPESKGYDQIHILGHGGPLTGLLFAREGGPGWASFTETEDMGKASDVFPLKPDGNSKIIIAACSGDKGQLRPWMRKSIKKDDRDRHRAFGVSGMWHVKYDTGADDPFKTPRGWKVQHPSMQAIARRLDIIP